MLLVIVGANILTASACPQKTSNMYIEFALPTGAGGQAAQYVSHLIRLELQAWAKKYDVKYQSKSWKYTIRVTFDDNSIYSLFAMTWMPTADNFTSYLSNYRLIEPMRYV